MDKVILPAGEYAISDPCYVLSDDDYKDSFLEQVLPFPDNREDDVVHLTTHGKEWVCFSTMYGDGTYASNHGDLFDVDAGCIACLPVELVREKPSIAPHTFHSTGPFLCWYDEDGTMYFGDTEVYTGYDEDD